MSWMNWTALADGLLRSSATAGNAVGAVGAVNPADPAMPRDLTVHRVHTGSPLKLTLPPSFLIMKKTRRNLAGARTALATLRTNLCLLNWHFHWGWLNQHFTHRQRLRFMGLASTLHQRKTQRRRWLRICCRG